MVISHEHEYLFVELPNTATSAIHAELCEYYGGVAVWHPTLGRHGYYHEFLGAATAEEKHYFVFSCIRNPLDVVVSLYFRFKTNHRGIFTDPEKWRRNGGFVSDFDLGRFDFVRATKADFPAYFQKYYRFPPYDNWSSLSHKEFDFIIRFEDLQRDFARVLELLGIEQERPLPVVNKTDNRLGDFWQYYTPEIRDQARKSFGPYMRKWGYDFPDDWGNASVPWSSQVLFGILSLLRRRLEWGSSFDARLFRRLLGL